MSTIATFTALNTNTKERLNSGATNSTALDILLKNVHPVFRSKEGWNALLAGVAAGDSIVMDNNRLAFDQLFVSSASGSYLDIRASDLGIVRPTYLGISDELFRNLTIALSNTKLITHAALEVLNVFYGDDSTRANLTSGRSEPFALMAGDTLGLSINDQNTTIVFFPSDFNDISKATATEVAAVITRSLDLAGIDAFSVAVAGAVKIYTGALGLYGRIGTTKCTAQRVFAFPTIVFKGVSTTPSLDWYQNSFTNGILTVSSDDSPIKIPVWDPVVVKPGDYIVLNAKNTWYPDEPAIDFVWRVKSFTVLASFSPGVYKYGWQMELETGLTVAPFFHVIDDWGASFTVDGPSLVIFNENQLNVTNGVSPAYVAQTTGNSELDIILPVTTLAVNRTQNNAMYPKDSALLSASMVCTRTTGYNYTIQATTTTNHGLSLNSLVEIDSIAPVVYSGGYATGSRLVGSIVKVTNIVSPTVFTFSFPELFFAGASVTFTNCTVRAVSVGIVVGDTGPYIYDPVEGLAITGVATTTSSALARFGSVSTLPVISTTGFSATGGWLTIGYATRYETPPIRYYGIKDSTNLILDRSYSFEQDIPSSSSVTHLFQRDPWVPADPGLYGSTYITASNYGFAAVQSVLDSILGAGIVANKIPLYPGDRGLAGEGLPYMGSNISDEVYVWGSDSPDTDWRNALNV